MQKYSAFSWGHSRTSTITRFRVLEILLFWKSAYSHLATITTTRFPFYCKGGGGLHLSTIFERPSVKPLRSRKTNANAIFQFRALKTATLSFQTFSQSKCKAKITIDSKTTIRRGEKNTEIRRISQIVGNVFRLDPMEFPRRNPLVAKSRSTRFIPCSLQVYQSLQMYNVYQSLQMQTGRAISTCRATTSEWFRDFRDKRWRSWSVDYSCLCSLSAGLVSH